MPQRPKLARFGTAHALRVWALESGRGLAFVNVGLILRQLSRIGIRVFRGAVRSSGRNARAASSGGRANSPRAGIAPCRSAQCRQTASRSMQKYSQTSAAVGSRRGRPVPVLANERAGRAVEGDPIRACGGGGPCRARSHGVRNVRAGSAPQRRFASAAAVTFAGAASPLAQKRMRAWLLRTMPVCSDVGTALKEHPCNGRPASAKLLGRGKERGQDRREVGHARAHGSRAQARLRDRVVQATMAGAPRPPARRANCGKRRAGWL
jgi:hypothetical protein